MEIWTAPDKNGNSKLIETGTKVKPTDIGADDMATYTPRTAQEMSGTPPAIFEAEVRHLVPVANQIATAIGISFLQEAQYGNVIRPLRERSVFVVLNTAKPKIDHGVATYHGLVVMCKRHPIVRVVCKLQIETGAFGVAQVHLWRKDAAIPDGGTYHVYGDREMRKPIPIHEVTTVILEYLENRERVLSLR